MRRLAVLVGILLVATVAHAVTSTRTVPSPLDMGGFNTSLDGRLFVGDSGVWSVKVFRPERLGFADGFATVGDVFSERHVIDPNSDFLNAALAVCEPARQPTSCDAAGAPSATGGHDCYDLVILGSRLDPPNRGYFVRRGLKVIVSAPRTRNAAIKGHVWTSAAEPLSPPLYGIEPTVTADGKLFIFHGIDDSGENDLLQYSVNATACAATGWSPVKHISSMNTDPLVVGKYRLAEKPLRAADGTEMTPGSKVKGAYPWVFPEGEALNFSAALMPCRSFASPPVCGGFFDPPCVTREDPPGCGPRRSAHSVIGYPTNWTLAHVDGDVNPSTADTVRLFFISPGKQNFLPLTPGNDVWPMFGGTTQNYTEIVFDDGLDGNYAGFWHMNELVDRAGDLDRARVADSSGYFNTARAPSVVPARDLISGPVNYNGTSGATSIADAAEFDPTAALSIELAVTPASDPNCDSQNNFRWLYSKGAAYSLALEESRHVLARVGVAGGVTYDVFSTRRLPVGVTTRIAVVYTAATGELLLLFDGGVVGRKANPPALLLPNNDALTVGGLAGTWPACPVGGVFHGSIDDFDVGQKPLTPRVEFPAVNNGVLGKAIVLDGTTSRLEVAHATSLNPVNAMTLEMAVKPASEPDCDSNNNFRVLLRKGTSYSLMLEENRHVIGRVRVAGGIEYAIASQHALPLGAWSKIGLTYEGATGVMAFWVDGVETNKVTHPAAALEGTTDPLTIGGMADSAACPDGAGTFHGSIDEVAVSRVVRDLRPPAPPTGIPVPDAGAADAGGPQAEDDDGGCSCSTSGSSGALGPALLALIALAWWRRR